LRRGRAPADQADATLTRAVERQGVRLARAARVLQADEAARILERVIGCGPGLTPSGDDLVTGFLAGLFSTAGEGRARRGFLEAFCRTVAAAAGCTTDISRTYLSHAVAGGFAEPLVKLARQIGAGGDHGAIESATTAALRVGHSSGSAGVFGLLLGLNAWPPDAPRRVRHTSGAGVSGLLPGVVTWSSKAALQVRHRSAGAAVWGLLPCLAAWVPRAVLLDFLRPTPPLAACVPKAALLELARQIQPPAPSALSGRGSCRIGPDRLLRRHRTTIPPRRPAAVFNRMSSFACLTCGGWSMRPWESLPPGLSGARTPTVAWTSRCRYGNSSMVAERLTAFSWPCDEDQRRRKLVQP
jgi:hypothetical protein